MKNNFPTGFAGCLAPWTLNLTIRKQRQGAKVEGLLLGSFPWVCRERRRQGHGRAGRHIWAAIDRLRHPSDACNLCQRPHSAHVIRLNCAICQRREDLLQCDFKGVRVVEHKPLPYDQTVPCRRHHFFKCSILIRNPLEIVSDECRPRSCTRGFSLQHG